LENEASVLKEFLESSNKIKYPNGGKDSDKILHLKEKNDINISEIFANPNLALRVELCSGMGEWIVKRCFEDQESNYIAVERRVDRVYKIWSRMVLRNINNLFIICGDSYLSLRSLPRSSVSEIFINFPDPPHSIDNKDFLFTPIFIKRVSRVLTEESKITILTDDNQYRNLINQKFEDFNSNDDSKELKLTINGKKRRSR